MDMKLQILQEAVAGAQQEFQDAETKAVAARLSAKAAKAAAEKSRVEHKRARKAAKQARKIALKAENKAEELAAILAKAQKRLAKALKKMGPVKVVQKPRAKGVTFKSVRAVAKRASSSKPVAAKKAMAPAPPAR